MLSGIVHALRCGGRWADCADVYRPKKNPYNRFFRWSERRVWEGIFSALAGAERAHDRLFIDSTCIKVHRCADGAKGGSGSWHRPHQGRPEHQAPRGLRRERSTCRPAPDPRQRPRLQSRSARHRRHAPARRTGRRQGLRQPGPSRMAGRARNPARHPATQEPQIQYDYDAVIITQAQHHRAQVLQAQGTVPHAIRFDRNIKSFLGAIALVASLIWWL